MVNTPNPPRRNCGTARVVANLLLIGCLIAAVLAVAVVVAVVVYLVWVY